MAQDDIEAREGGIVSGTPVSAPSPRVAVDPQVVYGKNKRWLDAYIAGLKDGAKRTLIKALQNTNDFSTRGIASQLRSASALIWGQNYLLSWFGISPVEGQIPIQRECNDKLFTHTTDDGKLNHIKSDDFMPLFAFKNPADWPNLVLTSNHARAWQSKDLTDVMKGVERLASDAWGQQLDLLRLKNNCQPTPEAVRNKTIIALACHTEKDVFLNGANLIDRRLNLEEDPNKNNPARRSMEGISPAAVRLAKLMLKLMVEPQEAKMLVDLDRPCVNSDGHFREDSFVACAHNENLVLRADAPSIAQHIKLVGYSKGANTVADALRYFYREYAALGTRLQVRAKDGKMRPASDKDIKAILSNVGLLSIAPGEVPLTDKEKFDLGIHRATLLNTEDLTAGHLVKPDAAEYHPYSDRLIQFEGALEEMGHSIAKALGKDGESGYIMNPANADKPGYQAAQDEVKSYFASNFGKQAITTLCFSHTPTSDELKKLQAEGKPINHRNELYIQFAPGISRVEEAQVELELAEVLKASGFEHPLLKSDLTDRRRVQVVLDHGHSTIEQDVSKLKKCMQAFKMLEEREGSHLFLTHDVEGYIQKLIDENTPKPKVHEGQSQGSRRVYGPAFISAHSGSAARGA